jgi:hypothetical protein
MQRTCLKADSRIWMGQLIWYGCFEAKELWSAGAQPHDPYRSKVAEEMLRYVSHTYFRACNSTYKRRKPYEGAVQQDCEASLWRGSCQLLRYSSAPILRLSAFMKKQGMVERTLCMRRCTHASVRRMGLQIRAPRCLEAGGLLAESGGSGSSGAMG